MTEENFGDGVLGSGVIGEGVSSSAIAPNTVAPMFESVVSEAPVAVAPVAVAPVAVAPPPLSATPATPPVDLAANFEEGAGGYAPQKLVTKMSPGRWFRELGWRHLVGILATIYAVFPIIFIISAALSRSGTMTGSNQLFSSVSLDNFRALNQTPFWHWFGNTMLIAIITAIGTVLMGAAAAYAFSRFNFRGRRGSLTALLVIQMFPQMLAFVAVFLLVMTLGNSFPALGLNSRLALICVYLGGALGVNTFLMYGFFNTVPKSLDEAAKIDGATHTQIYWTIILRMVTPILAVVGLLSFISTFGEFIIARLILQSQGNWTLAVGLFSWVSDQLNANWGVFAAGAVLSALPVMILFLFLQKYIVGGLTAGAVKG